MKDKLKVLDLFAGAGGFTLAGEMSGGFVTKAFCEIDKYAQGVLRARWPGVPVFDDVTKLTAGDVDGTIDVITGGFPCQDLSSAGRGAGIGEGTRSGLFREMLRIACEIREKQGRLPYIIFENVPRLLSGPSEEPGEWFGEFLWALAEVGYDAEWFCISAASVGAPHVRERVCVVAYPHQTHIERGGVSRRVYEEHANIDCGSKSFADPSGQRQQGQGVFETRVSSASIGTWKTTYAFSGGIGTIWEVEPTVGRVADGIPNQSHRLGMMGNAIVPQVFYLPMKALYEAHIDATQ